MSAPTRLNGKAGLGWHTATVLLGMLIGLAGQLFVFGQWMGHTNAKVDALKDDVSGLKRQVTDLATRREFDGLQTRVTGLETLHQRR